MVWVVEVLIYFIFVSWVLMVYIVGLVFLFGYGVWNFLFGWYWVVEVVFFLLFVFAIS